jgi:tetratricopeptide (TPR) repeat protein
LAGVGARLAGWVRRHPLSTMGGSVVLVVLLSWGGYKGLHYYRANSHYRAAQQAVDRQDWLKAREEARACLADWPDSAAGHLLAARVARRLELFKEADGQLDTCQRLQGGESHGVKVERALLQVQRGDLAGAENFLRDCVKQDDADAAEILDILSAAYILQYRVIEALRCLDELLQRRPDDFDILVRRAWTSRVVGWTSDAVPFFEKALAVRPEADNVRLAIAEIQIGLGRYDEAQAHLEQLRQRDPNNPAVLFGLAGCLAGHNRKEEAIRLLDQLLTDHPKDWQALSERGWLAVELDRPAEGEPFLQSAYALAPPDLPVLVRLADCLRALDKQEEARNFRGKADRLKAEMQRASDLGDLIRDRRPNDPDLRCELGCILLRLGKSNEGLHELHTALEKDPGHRKTHEALLDYYQSIGDFRQADQQRRFLQGQVSKSGEQSP